MVMNEQPDRTSGSERIMDEGWKSHEEEQTRLDKLTMPEKMQWLEDAQRLVRQLHRPTIQCNVLQKLVTACELSPNVRIGQVLAHLDYLARDMFDRGVGDIDDRDLLRVLERRETELARGRSRTL
jgi:hypothetical protein